MLDLIGWHLTNLKCLYLSLLNNFRKKEEKSMGNNETVFSEMFRICPLIMHTKQVLKEVKLDTKKRISQLLMLFHLKSYKMLLYAAV